MNTNNIAMLTGAFTALPGTELTKQVAAEIVTQMLSAATNVQEMYVAAKWLEEIAGLVQGNLKPGITEELEEKIDVAGAVLSITRTKEYSYSHDSQWNDLKTKEAEYAIKRKAREEILRNMTEEKRGIKPAEFLGVKKTLVCKLPAK